MQMSLRNRIRLIWVALIVLWVFVWLRYSDKSGGKWELLSAFLVTVVGLALANILARGSLRKLRKALSIEDIPIARREHTNLADFWRRRGRETIKAYGVNILLLEERYQEALHELQGLDTNKLGKKSTPVIENQIAWCKAQLGEPGEAIEISQSVLPQLESMGPDYGSSAHLVMGAANLFLDRPSEALPHFEKTYTTSTDAPTRKSIAAYYLGEALSGLGRVTDARKAHQQACDALPNGRFGKRAAERLK
jgi:tetratricopeptide (TPR) repeat protein